MDITSKADMDKVLFNAVQQRIETALKARTTKDEVTEVSVEGLSMSEIFQLKALYQEKGWRVQYEYCPGEYEDLWFS